MTDKVGTEEAQGKTVKTYLNPAPRSVHVRTLTDAKWLLSRSMTQLQGGRIHGQDAKDLCYLLSTFVQVVKDADIEERLTKLEQATGDNVSSIEKRLEDLSESQPPVLSRVSESVTTRHLASPYSVVACSILLLHIGNRAGKKCYAVGFNS